MVKVYIHNVQHFGGGKRSELTQAILSESPDIFLLTSIGLKDGESLKVPGYREYIKSWGLNNRLNDGWAIGCKAGLKHTVLKCFDKFLAVRIQLRETDIVLATVYLPPRLEAEGIAPPYGDFMKLVNIDVPAYICGDLNARSAVLGDPETNPKGRFIA